MEKNLIEADIKYIEAERDINEIYEFLSFLGWAVYFSFFKIVLGRNFPNWVDISTIKGFFFYVVVNGLLFGIAVWFVIRDCLLEGKIEKLESQLKRKGVVKKMSVQSHYIMIGANIGYEKENEDDWEKYEVYREGNHPSKIRYISDGNTGKYFVIGKVLAYDPEGFEGLSLFEYDEALYVGDKKEIKEHVKEHFDMDIEPTLIVFTHWR